MSLSPQDLLSLGAAVVGVLMTGSRHLRLNIRLLSAQVVLLSVITALYGLSRHDLHMIWLAVALLALKAIFVPWFLAYVARRVGVQRDIGHAVPLPLAMHIAIAFLGVSVVLAKQLPVPPADGAGWPGAAAGISLICTGLLLMLTRRVALSQIIGFLVMENGIYLFGATQTEGMPMLVEMGVMLDVLVGVMISGLLAFRIKKSFEHIDVSMLAELKE